MGSKLIVIFVFIFDVIAFGLAVAAEQRRSTGKAVPDKEKNYVYCSYDSDISTGYGIGAFFLLMISQILIMGASRCFCCSKPLKPGGARASAVVLFILCWVCFFIAEVCLLAGSARNSYHPRHTTIFGVSDPDCETIRKGVFAAGAAFTFFTAIVSALYFLCYSKARDGFEAPFKGETGVGMGSY